MRFRDLASVLGLGGVALVLGVGCGGGARSIERAPVLKDTWVSPFARVQELTARPIMGGVMVQGTAGDWILENERFSVVVRGLDNLGGFALSGGNIIDAAPRGSDDLLAEVFTYFNDTFARQAIYDHLDSPGDADSAGAVLVARGHDSEIPALEVETRYTLFPASDFLELHTRVTNTGADTLVDFELGDVIEWGRARAFLPGPGHDVLGYRKPFPFLVGANARTAYVWKSPEGNCTGPHGRIWSDPVVKTVTLNPGDQAVYTRRLFITRGPAQNGLRLARHSETGVVDLRISVLGNDKKPISGAWITATDSLGLVQGWGETLGDGSMTLPVPPGRYHLDIRHPHHGATTRDAVRPSRESKEAVAIRFPEPAHVTLGAQDEDGKPSPARWTFEGMEGTPDPDLGPDYRGPGTGRYVLTADGKGETLLPAGSYRVTASRGPGYETDTFTLHLREREKKTLKARLERMPIPRHWAAADFHVHANPSPDCSITLEDRVRSLVCEGVDWFAGSDHRRRTDYQAVLDTLDLAAALHVLPSEEVTTTYRGHFGAFPLTLHRDLPGNGATRIHDVSARDILSALREESPGVLVQLNHPRSGANGYFDLVGDPIAADSGAVGSFLDFDLMEIVNGKMQQSLDTVWKDWMNILSAGHRVVGVGNSDSHFLTGQEVGYPRNYVMLDSSSVPGDQEALVTAVREGRVVVSYGPFIHFTLEDQEVGTTVVSPNGRVRGHIRVIAPSWVDVRRVAVYVNGVEAAEFLLGDSDRAIRFDEDFELPLKQSSFVLVKVEGDASLAPVVPALGADTPPILPLAFTNPIWVEMESSSP